MSLFQCEECGCCENTAVCNYHTRSWGDDKRALCSACDPTIKEWHGKFDRTFYPIGTMHTDADGNLAYGPEEMTRKHRNSPSISKYKLGFGNDFDWKFANQIWQIAVNALTQNGKSE